MLIPGPAQLGMIALIVALVFGTKKLRAFGGDLGGMFKGIKDGFREASQAADELAPEVREAINDVKNLHSKGAEFLPRPNASHPEAVRNYRQPDYSRLMDEQDELDPDGDRP